MNLFKKLFGKKITKSEAARKSNLRSYSGGNTTSTTSSDNSWFVPAVLLTSSNDGYAESTRSRSDYDCSSSYDSGSNYSSSDSSSSSSCD